MSEKQPGDTLVRLLKEGHADAFKAIFDLYYRPLTLFAIKYVGDTEEAREITQEFFIRLWSKRADLQIYSLKTYLYQGVRNACLNYLQSSKVVQRHMKDYENPSFTNDNALEKMMAAEQEEILLQAIDRLPEKCREIFYLSRMEKLTNKAIADKLQISIKTVEAQMSIALKRLRQYLISLLLLVSGFSL